MSFLKKSEDIDQYLYSLRDRLTKVKLETASVIAEENKIKSRFEEEGAKAERLQTLAQNSIAAGNDKDARLFLQQKKAAEERAAALQPACQTAAMNSEKMRQMYYKLVADIEALEARRDSIRFRMSAAERVQSINETKADLSDADNSLAGSRQIREELNQVLDRLEAEAELESGSSAALDELMEKYK